MITASRTTSPAGDAGCDCCGAAPQPERNPRRRAGAGRRGRMLGLLLWSLQVGWATGSLCGAQPHADDSGSASVSPSAAVEGSSDTVWFSELEPAYRDALVQRRPILVQFTGPFCPWCKKLGEEFRHEHVRAELARWTLAAIDAEASPAAAQRWSVTALPAMRVLSTTGRLIASRDGYLPADELLQWLRESREQAARSPDEVLMADREPSLMEVMRLVRQFGEREAALREAAIRRLLPYPAACGAAVIRTLEEGNLSAKLAAFELLSEWKAPLDRLDPWRPESVTAESIAALEAWLQQIDPAATPVRDTLTEEQLDELRSEIRQMLAGDPAEAVAARERIARMGRGSLPEVYAQLQQASSDSDRQRLLTLRFRLVADHALVMRWPGGLERLAAGDPQVRRKAAEELAAIAGPESQSLLLELFSHPDALVREVSLRGLRNLGGREAIASLAQLLNDPEWNVRAAVLKLLAEDGSVELLPTIAKYVEQESDPALIVHAVRYLRKTRSRRAGESLIRLLEHESWQVRADAAESLGELLEMSQYSEDTSDLVEKVYDALLAVLADEDAFVVSRALDALKRVNARHAVEPLVQAAQVHPALAAKIVDILAVGSQMREQALPHLRQFLEHADPAVRAAAVRGLCEIEPDGAEQVLTAAMEDAHTLVRIAVADALLKRIAAGRPQWEASGPTFSDPFGMSLEMGDAAPAAPELDTWLAELRDGKHRPEWTANFVEAMEHMLHAETPEERVAAALALVPLGRPQAALPVLLEAAPSAPKVFEQCCVVLKWLPREERIDCYHELQSRAQDADQRSHLVMEMSEIADAQIAELFWPILEQPEMTRSAIAVIDYALRRTVFGDRYYDPSEMTSSVRRSAVEAVTPHAKSGRPLKRLVAINLLLSVAAEDALALAQELMDDETVEPEFRGDAFELFLAGQTPARATEVSVEALSGGDGQRRIIALKYLALGSQAQPYSLLRHTQITVQPPGDVSAHVFGSSQTGQPITPTLPRRLKADPIRPLLDDPDPEIAAYSGYLLALFGEPEGLPPLLRYWRSLEQPDDQVARLVYRAIAVLDDPAHVPLLREVYSQLTRSNAAEFYWTIRIMTGPEILQFRRLIRQEVGMSELR